MQSIVRTRSISMASTVLAISAFTLFQALSAKVRMPLFFTPVPVTLQTLVVLFSIFVLKRNAVFSQALYITLGICGIPLFSAGAGPAYLLGPTGGYIFGFFVVALCAPFFLEQFRHRPVSLAGVFLFCLLSLSGIYVLGAFWLKTMCALSLHQAMLLGVLPFVPGALMKAAIAAIFGFYYLQR